MQVLPLLSPLDVMRRDADGDAAFSLAPIGRTLALCMDEGWESFTMLDIWRMSRFGHKNQVVVLLAGCKLLPAKAVLSEAAEKTGPPKRRFRKEANLHQAHLQDRLRRICKDGLAQSAVAVPERQLS